MHPVVSMSIRSVAATRVHLYKYMRQYGAWMVDRALDLTFVFGPIGALATKMKKTSPCALGLCDTTRIHFAVSLELRVKTHVEQPRIWRHSTPFIALYDTMQ